MTILITLLGLLLVLSDFANSQQTCVTPDNKNGACTSLRDCAELFQIVLDFKSSTQAQREFLRRSQCQGSISSNPVVCCQQAPNVQTIPSVNSINWSILPPPGQCGTEAKDRIFGGTTTTITDYPWMALIQYTRTRQGKQQQDYLCGGSLINKDYVVTAAHCAAGTIVRNGWKATGVRLGEHDLREDRDCDGNDCADPVVDVGVTEVIVHEDYVPFSTTQYNDIALLRLSRSIQITDYIRPVCLPIAPQLRDKNFDNAQLEVAGFGRTENGRSSDVKLKLELPGFNWSQCNNIYQVMTHIPLVATQLCAGGEANKDTCGGDSGGPLMGYDSTQSTLPYTYLAGIVSRGPAACGTKAFPGVYTRVDQYLEWIVKNMRG